MDYILIFCNKGFNTVIKKWIIPPRIISTNGKDVLLESNDPKFELQHPTPILFLNIKMEKVEVI